ncbi:hypothetical protein PGB90_002541 [Kerria lacca]
MKLAFGFSLFLEDPLLISLIAVASCNPINKRGYIASPPLIHAPIPVVTIPAAVSHSSVVHHSSPNLLKTAPVVSVVQPVHHAPLIVKSDPILRPSPVILKPLPVPLVHAVHPAPLLVKPNILPAVHTSSVILH